MTTNRSMIAKSLVPGVHKFVGMSYGDTPEQHVPLYDIRKSNRAFEEAVMMVGTGPAGVKPEGSAVVYDDVTEGWTARFNHETIAIAIAITKEAIDDDQYGNLAMAKAKELGRSMAETKQTKATAVFNRAFNSSYTGGDGVSLCNTAHPMANGDTFSNKVVADLSESALEDASIAIRKFTNDRGILISARAKSLIVPPDLMYVAQRVLKSDLSTSALQNVAKTENVSNRNDINALKSLGQLQDGVHINDRLTDPGAWFLKTTVDDGTVMFVREELNGDDDVSFDNDTMLFKFRERYSFGWINPRGIYGATGT